MDFTTFSQTFSSAAAKNGILPPNEAQTQRFYRFTEHLLEVNTHTNLTAIREPVGVVDKHYIDSLLAMCLIPEGARVLDLGCGAALSSLFLANETQADCVWALDLWVSPTDNLQRIRENPLEHKIIPIHGDALALPFAHEYFDTIVSVDTYHYFGCEDNIFAEIDYRAYAPVNRRAQAGAVYTSN